MPFFETSSARLHYELIRSAGPAFVLVHGALCSHGDWAHQRDALSRDHSVLTLDLRGHGQSDDAGDALSIEGWASDLNAMIESLDIGPAVLVGHSMGTRVVAEAAHQRPDGVLGLVLVDGGRLTGGFAGNPTGISNAGTAQGAGIGPMLDGLIGPYAAPPIRDHVRRTMSASGGIFGAVVAAISAWDAAKSGTVFAALPRDLPMLAIQSSYYDHDIARHSLESTDGTTPYLDFLKQAHPEIETRILPRTGHFSMLERPDQVSDLIRDFGLSAMASREGV